MKKGVIDNVVKALVDLSLDQNLIYGLKLETIRNDPGIKILMQNALKHLAHQKQEYAHVLCMMHCSAINYDALD